MSKQRRILLVEDDDNLRDLVAEWLVFEKYAVVSCGSGAEAIEQLSMLDFEAMILDWHLGDMSGIAILQSFRASGGKTPVLILTGNNSASERDLALSAGANTYMSKPFKLDALSKAVAELILSGEAAGNFSAQKESR